MKEFFQCTLAKPSVRLVGVGLHCGQPVSLRLLPAEENSGLVFWRTDLGENARINSNPEAVIDTLLSTCIGDTDTNEQLRVNTVEHLLSALYALGIDNAIIEIEGLEIPSMDGSAAPFILLLKDAGIVAQTAKRKHWQINQKVTVSFQENGSERSAKFEPADSCNFEIEVDFPQPPLKTTRQKFSFCSDRDDYQKQIATARTFGFVEDLDRLRKNQRGLGGTLENAIVISDNQILNPEGLRYKDEFIRHKMLDVIGDCYIGGKRIIGKFSAYKPGHKLNNMLLRKLNVTPGCLTEID